jgi:hypothetical protein
MMALIPRQLEFQHVPSIQVRGNLHILKRHVEATHSSEELLFVNFSAQSLCWLPVFELPLIAAAENTDHSSPLRITEALCAIIDIKSDLSFVYHPLNLDWLCSISRVINVVAFFKELLHISDAK